ncbi:MAG: efflux RND transporter periplasmic adaptor subunit [Candidatus Omnitrophica bacterium]|nr:efflux RND transporter periplasmic adaptor subunit [Candidatus Omnitrophota bacterium]
MSKRIIIIICILLAVVLHFSCNKSSKKEDDQVKPVKTMVVGATLYGNEYKYPGKVEAFDDAMLAFEVSGQIIDFPAQRGEVLEKDQLIAQVDPRDFENELNAKKSQFTRASSELERYRNLYEDDAVALNDLEIQERNFDVAKADLQNAQKAYNDTMIKAPFNGVVAQKFVENYQNVQAKEPIVRFQNIETLKVEINIPESDVGGDPKDRKDIKAYATFEGVPDKKFDLKLFEWETRADNITHTFKVTFSMPAPTETVIMPGMTANVSIEYKGNIEKDQYFYVPASAVFSKEDGTPVVWVVDQETMKVQQKQVNVESMSASNIKITEGLKAGDMIATTGVYVLSPGDKIRSIKDIYKGE